MKKTKTSKELQPTEEIKVKEIKLVNPGMLLMPWPENIYRLIKQSIVNEFGDSWSGPNKKIKRGTPANARLAGHIAGEFNLPMFEPLKTALYDITKGYMGYYQMKWSEKISHANMWANFSEKYEFNPMHNHTGDLTWVSWINIPYSLEAEDSLDNSKTANCKMNSRFHFMYNTLTGKVLTHQLAVDNDWEGKLIIFPATLFHAVYPFYTSDDYRISIAGNLGFEPLEKE